MEHRVPKDIVDKDNMTARLERQGEKIVRCYTDGDDLVFITEQQTEKRPA